MRVAPEVLAHDGEQDLLYHLQCGVPIVTRRLMDHPTLDLYNEYPQVCTNEVGASFPKSVSGMFQQKYTVRLQE